MTTTTNTSNGIKGKVLVSKRVTLTADREMYRDDDGWSLSTTVSAGQEVAYTWIQTDTEDVRTATYTDEEGHDWHSIVRTPRQPAPPATTIPPSHRPTHPAPTPAVRIVPSAPVNVLAVSAPSAPTPAAVASVQTGTQHTTTAVGSAVSAIARRQERAVDTQENRVRSAARAVQMLSGTVYQLNYYIPDVLRDKVPNPSRILRRHAYRLDGSNWVIPEAGLHHKDVQAALALFNVMPVETPSGLDGFPNRVRADYWHTPYTPEQLATMREKEQERLRQGLLDTHTSLIERIESASTALRTAREALDKADEESRQGNGAGSTERDRAKLDNTYHGALRATINETCERFLMCLRGAELFDDTGSLDALFGAVRDAIAVQAAAVNATLRAKKVKTVALPTEITG